MEAAILNSEDEKDNRLDLALSLVNALEQGDEESADLSIIKLTQSYEASLFNEIGQITRHVHDSLGFCSDESRISEIAEQEIPDARQRLHYVIEKTEHSANLTLDIAEGLLRDAAIFASDAEDMKIAWQKFTRREMDLGDFRGLSHRLENFLAKIEEDTEKFRGNITDLMVAQDFQDLTGQIIKQVIELVQEVECKLVDVIRHAGTEKSEPAEHLKDIKAEGPQIDAKSKPHVVNDQEDVDSLLSSLGF